MATAGQTKSVLKDLMEKKDAIENEIKELMSVLESQQGVGMDGSLLDAEQYPRADIDIHTVRHARNTVIRLQNDHKELMKQIEEGLHQYHAQTRVDAMTNRMESMPLEQAEAMEVDAQRPQAFAKVDRVDIGSPADTAGLQVGDHLVKFGSVTCENFKSLHTIGEIVQHSKGRALQVTILRNSDTIELPLTPQSWSGRGLLGCNIVPTPKGP